MRYVFFSFLVLFFLLISFSKALANTIKISPAYVDVTLNKAGDEKSFEISITNKTDKKIRVDFSSLDFKQTDPFGAITFLGREIGNYTYSLSSFLTFDNPFLEIDKGKKKILVVTARNREDLSPGGHYAAVIVRQTSIDESEKTIISPALSSLI